MRKAWFLGIFYFFPLHVIAGDGDYAVSKINPLLLKNAYAIKRFGEQRLEISSFTKTRLYKKTAITVLNEEGDEFASLYEVYDKFRSIKSIEGRLFNAEGKEIKSLKGKDIQDRSGADGSSLMDDNRVKSHNFYYKVYPYTVEYEVVTEFDNTYMLPHWFPQPGEHYAVEKSILSITCPASFGLRYKMFNYQGEPGINDLNDKKLYTWQVTNLVAISREYASPDFFYLTSWVFFSPDKFELEGYAGSMVSWKELGEFQRQLNQGKDKLPETVKQKVHALTDGIADSREKIRILYEYLQQNTRYVSIQLGIGGLQPFDASYVASKGYGDCKALTNYMYSLLKEVNIRSCYTQVRSGAGKYFFMPDFPSDQFDHIILCVPLQNDTVWLECTDQTLPAGYLSDFTCNRYALAIDESGGKLVHTPIYGIKENIEIRLIKAKLNEEATLQMKAVSNYGGLQQDLYHQIINNLSPDKVKEYLHEELDFATYDISSFAYKENKSARPSIEETLDIIVSNYATITGKRLFILPNVMTRTHRKLATDSTRKYDLELGDAYKNVDSVDIEIPHGYNTESMPQDVSLKSKFGKYECVTKFNGNHLYYYRTVEYYGGRYLAKDYQDLVKYYDAVYKADRNKVVLVKAE